MNFENLAKLRAHIASLPEANVKMNRLLYIDRAVETMYEAAGPVCGTVGCAAGHAALLSICEHVHAGRMDPEEIKLKQYNPDDDFWVNFLIDENKSLGFTQDFVHDEARAWLELTAVEASKFFLCGWYTLGHDCKDTDLGCVLEDGDDEGDGECNGTLVWEDLKTITKAQLLKEIDYMLDTGQI